MTDDFEDPRKILALLRSVARGDNPSRGRDELAGPLRVETGGMHGRSLVCVARLGEGAHHLVVGGGEIAVRMVAKGEFVFPYGAVTIDATDRVRGAAFVDAMAGWLGTPMDPFRAIGDDVAVEPIVGDYARLDIRDDADGSRWEAYKLMLAGERPTEVFLRICSDAERAAFTEKWSAYREPLLVHFDRHLGAGRGIAMRTRVDVMGGATLTVPSGWIVTRREAHIAITDPGDEVVFEVSHQPYPLDPRLPGLRARLELALTDVADRAAALAATIVVDRGDVEIAWTEYGYEATDTESGEKGPARSRILIAANDALQVLITYAFWPADTQWAISAWETIIATLRLATPATT